MSAVCEVLISKSRRRGRCGTRGGGGGGGVLLGESYWLVGVLVDLAHIVL